LPLVSHLILTQRAPPAPARQAPGHGQASRPHRRQR